MRTQVKGLFRVGWLLGGMVVSVQDARAADPTSVDFLETNCGFTWTIEWDRVPPLGGPVFTPYPFPPPPNAGAKWNPQAFLYDSPPPNGIVNDFLLSAEHLVRCHDDPPDSLPAPSFSKILAGANLAANFPITPLGGPWQQVPAGNGGPIATALVHPNAVGDHFDLYRIQYKYGPVALGGGRPLQILFTGAHLESNPPPPPQKVVFRQDFDGVGQIGSRTPYDTNGDGFINVKDGYISSYWQDFKTNVSGDTVASNGNGDPYQHHLTPRAPVNDGFYFGGTRADNNADLQLDSFDNDAEDLALGTYTESAADAREIIGSAMNTTGEPVYGWKLHYDAEVGIVKSGGRTAMINTVLFNGVPMSGAGSPELRTQDLGGMLPVGSPSHNFHVDPNDDDPGDGTQTAYRGLGTSAFLSPVGAGEVITLTWHGRQLSTDRQIGYGIDNVELEAMLNTWKVDAGGNWSQVLNWDDEVPNAVGQSAILGSAITATRIVTLDVPVTVTRLKFDNANGYTVGGPQKLTIDYIGGSGAIDVASGSHIISADVSLATSTTLTVTLPASSLTLSGALNVSPGVSLTKAGAGVLEVRNVRAQGLFINAGTVKVLPDGSDNGTSDLKTLSIAGATNAWTATLDLSDNDLIIDYSGVSPMPTVLDQIRSAYSGGSWSGRGISSSLANATTHALAYADNALYGLTSFSGQAVDDTSVLIKYTYSGDSNLDGQVDIFDLGRLATNWQTSGSWVNGDFDYSAFVDISDLGLLATNWQAGVGNPLGPSFAEAMASLGFTNVAVPEPATGAIILCLASLLARAWVARGSHSRADAHA